MALIEKLDQGQRRRLLKLMRERNFRKNGNRLNHLYPDTGIFRRDKYRKHVEFLNGGAKFRVRLFMAANRVGKTETGGYEVALHTTGLYPHWWKGRRFPMRTRWWVAGKSNKTTMDIIQAKLLGSVEYKSGKKVVSGTGMIPRHLIDMKSLTWKSGAELKDAVNSVRVRHVTGGWSIIQFKSYEQGRGAFEGTEREGIWFDEEPPMPVYTEALTRTMTTKGIVILTFTPLEGTTEVVDLIVKRSNEGKTLLINATWDDVPHLSAEDKQNMLDAYPKHEWDARSKGVPFAGSGLIFPVDEKEITIDPIEIPRHWPMIIGLDFGWDHPTSAVLLAWDRDDDVIYIVDEYRESERSVQQHAPHILALNNWCPVAWPHDGFQHDKGSGEQLRQQYEDEGLNMLPENAKFDDGTNGVEAGLSEMLVRMQKGKLKVFNTCTHWLDERRMYHREKGKVVKKKDDTISASRYAMMMIRFAATKPVTKPIKQASRNNVC